MGRKNDVLCRYLNRPGVFADFCNGSIYGGRTVIAPYELAEAQRNYSEKRRRKYCEENEERLRHMDVETYEVICTMLDMDSLLPEQEEERNEEKEEYDMCTAIREMIMDGKKEGIEIGKKEGIEIGEKRGKELGEKRGEKRLGLLMEKLLQDGRLEDALRASRYASVRRKLYLEYSI